MRRGLTLPAAVLATAALAAPASAASPDVVISEVYGGGGNAGATLRNDFVELRNRGTAPVDVTGWSVQYAAASGASWQVTRLAGTIAPGGAYLVQQAAGTGGTQDLPSPDATGSIAMSATSGKVALVTTAAALPCGADCDAAAGVRDFVGYGGANDFEGARPAPGLTNTTSASRAPGAPDTDQNAADFTAGAVTPQSSGSEPPPPPPPPAEARIAEVQGAGHRSPLVGARVSVPGVVTAVRSNGFHVQDPDPDADPRTSEGIFVFTGSAGAKPAVGQAVDVTGRVSEFRPGGDADNLTITQLDDAAFAVTGTGAVEPTVIGRDGRMPPTSVIDDDSRGDVERTPTFDPAQDGIDFYESLEGMLTEVRGAVAVGPTTSFGETPVLADGGAGAGVRTSRGGIVIRPTDFNPERIILDDAIAGEDVPALDVGDRFAAPVRAVVDYSFGNFKFLALAWPETTDGGLQREVTAAPKPNQLAVASFNVENLDAGDRQETFEGLARTLVDNLRAPDLVALEEIQDNDGAAPSGTTDASLTYARLIEAIRDAGGPQYEYRQIDPAYNQDGGEPGGNIRVAFLFRTDRGLSFVDRPGGDATTATAEDASAPGAQLTLSPGRIDPTDPAFSNSRKPLAGEFLYRGRTLFVIANHFASKGGDDPLFGRDQPPVRSSEAQRHRQAAAVNGFVDELLAADPRANVIVLGDINDFEFSRTTEILEGDGDLFSLARTLPEPERYTYVFDGNSQVLDQILVSQALLSPKPEYDSVHVNAEFADQVSDHDPQVALLRVTGAPAVG